MLEDVSSVAWFDPEDQQWRVAFPDGRDRGTRQNDLLWLLRSDDPREYARWAAEYYEVDVPLASVQAIYQNHPLTERLVESLNPDVTLNDVKEDAEGIGYALQAM